ncbi:hypothetical protein AAFF_G00129740 [Aldrovandia affinis]|uniref:Uncharacterized protein n=1 Tax=Aldrovandia affinis TaxID=143900 RepID=A0AAD7RQT9_9TELE|nr:hypothetical protein AAFF_G00129740 [Aldrovandia affinis]
MVIGVIDGEGSGRTKEAHPPSLSSPRRLWFLIHLVSRVYDSEQVLRCPLVAAMLCAFGTNVRPWRSSRWRSETVCRTALLRLRHRVAARQRPRQTISDNKAGIDRGEAALSSVPPCVSHVSERAQEGPIAQRVELKCLVCRQDRLRVTEHPGQDLEGSTVALPGSFLSRISASICLHHSLTISEEVESAHTYAIAHRALMLSLL